MRTYEAWMEEVASEIRQGLVWKFFGYRKALFLYDLVWRDCEHWQQERRGWAIVDQIARSAGSISANIEEGYGRGPGRVYWRGRELLPEAVLFHRLALLDEIIALLVTEIKRQRAFAPQ